MKAKILIFLTLIILIFTLVWMAARSISARLDMTIGEGADARAQGEAEVLSAEAERIKAESAVQEQEAQQELIFEAQKAQRQAERDAAWTARIVWFYENVLPGIMILIAVFAMSFVGLWLIYSIRKTKIFLNRAGTVPESQVIGTLTVTSWPDGAAFVQNSLTPGFVVYKLSDGRVQLHQAPIPVQINAALAATLRYGLEKGLNMPRGRAVEIVEEIKRLAAASQAHTTAITSEISLISDDG